MHKPRFKYSVLIFMMIAAVALFGCSGDDGATGPAGAAGAAGEAGADGADGGDGADGATGATGSAGAGGADGATGSAGVDGADGTDGASGAAGADGVDGATGAAGADGVDGGAGADGADGAAGDSAYDIAVNNGFEGTEQQWLVSMRPASPAGDAADEAAAAGFTGSEEELLWASYEEAAAMSYSGTAEEWAALQTDAVSDVASAVAASHVVESCNVCHGETAIADIALKHPEPEPLEKPVVSGITLNRSAGDALTIDFHVEVDGDDMAGLTLSDVRAYLADIVPADTVTATAYVDTASPVTTFSTPYLQRWMYERSSTAAAGTALADNGDGDYTLTLVTTPADILTGSAAVQAVYSSASDGAPDGDLAHTQRLLLRVDGRDAGYNRTIGLMDFIMPAADASTTGLADLTRVIVDASACTACHNDPLQRAAHGGSYQSPQACNFCHSPIGNDYGDRMQNSGAWLASLMHKIHGAIEMEAFDTRIWVDENGDGIRTDDERHGYDYVTFPKNVKNCEICHFDNGQDMADAWKTNPTAEVCGSCHIDVDFADGTGHDGGAQADNALCAVCHPAAGSDWSVTTVHTVDTIMDKGYTVPSLTPNYTAAISMSAPANGDYYVAGEAPLVTVTVTGAEGNYTDDDDVSFTGTNLYVYGPRAKAVPVLTIDSTTDEDFIKAVALDPTETPDQGRSLFVGADDQVQTDADGFKYQLLAIPEGMESGTYMAMAYISHPDSRTTGSRNYNMDGWTLTTFQIGTATEELKVAGDGCQNCHEFDATTGLYPDWGTMYHRSYFGTDGCLACHDQSGNHANPIANRVHAVHSAQAEDQGDFLGKGFSDVTYPRDIDACGTCHSSGNESYINYKPAAWGFPCLGCHGDTAGAKDHMIQNGAPLGEH